LRSGARVTRVDGSRLIALPPPIVWRVNYNVGCRSSVVLITAIILVGATSAAAAADLLLLLLMTVVIQ